jgi:hypothetical protein
LRGAAFSGLLPKYRYKKIMTAAKIIKLDIFMARDLNCLLLGDWFVAVSLGVGSDAGDSFGVGEIISEFPPFIKDLFHKIQKNLTADNSSI